MNPRPKHRSPPLTAAYLQSPPLSPPPHAPKAFASKMPRKSFTRPTLAIAVLLVLITLYSFLLYAPPNYNTNTSINLGNDRRFRSPDGREVRIFMYDLPRRFTYGIIESYAAARGGRAAEDDAHLKYPGHQHSAEWYLFSDLNRPAGERVDSSVTRVMDPEEADLFYVPFFSSLSLIVNRIRPVSNFSQDGAVYNDEQTQEDLMEWLEEQVYWKRNNGWDHVFICQDPNALYKVIDRVKNGVLLVSDFGRLARNQASLVKDVILPYSHRINTYKGDVSLENRKSLLFFMGNRYRKEGGKIRDMLFQLLENEKDVIIKHGAQSRESRRAASQGMHSSRFCLHPAGDTPSACRLFDAIVSLCVPVIVSNYIELPFEDVIDYRKIAIFVDTNTAVKPRYLVKLLRRVSPEKIMEFQNELKKVKRYFEYEDPNGTVKEIWRQVASKLPLIKLMSNRDKRIVVRDLAEQDCSCLCSNQSRIHTTL